MQFLNSSKLTVLLVALVTIFGIHVIAQNSESLRADLTENKLYSLSDGSVALIDKMKQEGAKPIDLKLYFSETAGKSLPSFIKDFITYERYIRTLLQEYEVESAGKIRVEMIDPVPDSDDAQDALDFGLDGKPINQYGDLFFFGLVFQTQTGSRDVIEFLWPTQQETIEYEIAKRLQNLLWPTKQRIGVLSSLEVISDASNPYMQQILAAQGKNPQDSWTAAKLLQESYEVSKIGDVDHISPDEYDLVLVIHPKNLNDRALWALDEWIATGGSTLVMVDPYTIKDQAPQNPQQPWAAYQYKPASNLTRLFSTWGLQRPEDQVTADFDLAISRPVSAFGPAERLVVDLAIDPEMIGQTLAQDHPIFQGLESLRFFMAGSLERLDVQTDEDGSGTSGLTYTPLITTTAQGNTLEIAAGFPSGESLVFSDIGNPGKLSDKFTPGSEPVVMAYQIQGKFPSAFPNGADIPAETPAPPPGLPPGMQMPPPPAGESVRKEPVAEEQRKEATVMVFADVDFIADEVAFSASPFGVLAVNDNHRVLLNAVDYLFGSEELMKVRAKKSIQRPFKLFDEIEAQADRQTLEREKELRAEIEGFQQQLQEKQSGISASNAALFQKQVQDEVDELNERILQANAELRDIRKEKRAALEGEEGRIRFATLWSMPTLVLGLGLFLLYRRRMQNLNARRNKP